METKLAKAAERALVEATQRLMNRSLKETFTARVRSIRYAGWGVAICVLAPLASADTLPASLRACAAEPDANRRLACFDNAVAPYVANSAAVGRKQTEVIAQPETAGASGGTGPAAAALAGPAVRGPTEVAKTQAAVPQQPEHVKARVVSLKNSADRLVVRLDNGDVWGQIEDANGTLNLRVGDMVTVDRSLGSYWLSGRSQISMKVRRQE